jgi:Acyl-coenzyme A:6-aminopenicillanic acid acyl-transferase
MSIRKLSALSISLNLIIIFLIMLLVFSPGCQGEMPTTQGQADHINTLNSLQKINDYPFYTLTYYGDYGFGKYLETGQMPSFFAAAPAADDRYACTCFAAMGSDSCRLFGRNFDWTTHIALLLFSDPPDGYASVSMIDLEHSGYSDTNPPDAGNNRYNLLQAPFLPMDGMNEKGLAVGIMAVPQAQAPYVPGRVTLYTAFVVRLLLDYAASVEEAIELIDDYNISFATGTPCHFMVADSSGQSVIIEFIDGTTRITRPDEALQVCTNFIVYGTQAPDNVTCWRYNTAYDLLRGDGGDVDQDRAMYILSRVVQGQPYSTMWSMVYNLKTLGVDVVINSDFQVRYHFQL